MNTQMKMNPGVVTPHLNASKKFYSSIFQWKVVFENEFYLLMQSEDGGAVMSFLLPEHASQQPLFHKAFTGQGLYLTMEVEDVNAWYERVQSLGVPIAIPLRKEPWGDHHFAITDPNGVNIDLVHYQAPGE